MRYALLWRPTLLRWGGCCTAAQPNEAVWVCSLLARLQRQASGCSWHCACVSLCTCMSCSSPLSTCTELLGAQGKLPCFGHLWPTCRNAAVFHQRAGGCLPCSAPRCSAMQSTPWRPAPLQLGHIELVR